MSTDHGPDEAGVLDSAHATAAEIADVAVACAEHVTHFGLTPKIALLSHSDFGQSDSASARKMRSALELIAARAPELQVDGEMQADSALSELIRDRVKEIRDGGVVSCGAVTPHRVEALADRPESHQRAGQHVEHLIQRQVFYHKLMLLPFLLFDWVFLVAPKRFFEIHLLSPVLFLCIGRATDGFLRF